MEIKLVEKFVKEELINDCTGHDFMHVQRVANMAFKLKNQLGTGDSEVIILSAYLHDIIDDKVVKNTEKAKKLLIKKLKFWNIPTAKQDQIFDIIEHISFSKNLKEKYTLPIEGQIVQDADRLDAIGAIGIARAFYYGGYAGNPIYDDNFIIRKNLTEDDYRNKNTVINHFYEKLLKLESLMNTDVAKLIARRRTFFMKQFLDEFFKEWKVNE
ncbi:MAG: HD domain-containing protein [Methanobrevibacter sp.]|jgi:uncharacterized protein|nr:HD domain-containing protein [Candidatus Methanovirga aequatorialis]